MQSKFDPGSDTKKVQCGNHLVCSTEDRPDSLPGSDDLAGHVVGLGVNQNNRQGNYKDRRGNHANLTACELLDLITTKARSGVKRGQQEAVDGNSAKTGTERGIKTDKRRELTKALGENLNRRKPLSALKAKNHQRTDGDNGYKPLDKHSAVTDQLGILFAAKLAAGRAGADQAMETGNSAAGDQNEHSRPHRLGAEAKVLNVLDDHRHGLGVKVAAGKHAVGANADREVQEIRSEVVTGLKQHPHRQDRSKEDVNAKESVPEVNAVREDTIDKPGSSLSVDLRAAEEDSRKHNDRYDPQGHMPFVNHQSGNAGQDDEQRADKSDDRIGSKRTGRHDQEDCNDKDQRQDREAEEQVFTCLANVLLNDRANRVAVVTKRSNDCPHIVGTAQECGTDNAPQNRGQPTELHRSGDRPRDRTGTGDRSKVVAKKDCRVSGNKVDTVFELFSRGFVRVGKTVDVRHEASIHHIADKEDDRSNTKHHWKQHTTHLQRDLAPLIRRFCDRRGLLPRQVTP